MADSLPSTNQSVYWTSPSNAEIRDQGPVREPGEEEVVVQVISTGICGSDVHVWTAATSSPERVLGHESAGVIVKVGAGVKDKHVGQRAAIDPADPCMKCEFCIRSKPNVCANLAYCGLSRNGTLSQYYTCRSSRAVPFPEKISWEEAGCIQPLAIAVQLARKANVRPHQTVAIFGSGPLGLLIIAVLRAYSVSKIIAFDIEQSRVDFAVKYGADVGIVCPIRTESEEPLAFATSFVKKVLEEHGLGSGVDIAIEASGAEASVHMGVAMTKPCGTYVQAGLGKQLATVPLFLVTANDLTIQGTVRYGPGAFADAVDLLSRGVVDLKPLITSTYPMSKVNDAFKAQQARKDIKVVIMNQK